MTDYVLNKPVLEAWKRENDVSDQDLAVRFGVHQNSMNRWLNGLTRLPYFVVRGLEDITKIPAEVLAQPRTGQRAS